MSNNNWRSQRAKEPKVDPEQKIMLQKMMVGHYIEDIPKDCNKNISYVLQGDGIYEVRKNRLGLFITRLAKAEIPGLHSNLEETWQLNVPRIPASLLGTTVSFFRQIYKKHSSEVFLQFFYDLENDEYFIHCPKQTITMASVKYENDDLFNDENKILVFEIHSHGNMGAFFSGTDDSDEKADRFYGVIGNITNFFPDLKLRLSVGGHKIEVDVDELFDLDEEMYHAESFPKDWVDRIKKEKIKVVRGRRGKQQSWGFPGERGTYQNWASRNYGPACHMSSWGDLDLDDDDGFVHPGYPGNRNQEDEIDRLMREHYEENYLTSPNDIWDDDLVEIVEEKDIKQDPNGYFIQDGDKLWKIENGERVWYIHGGCKYAADEEPKVEVENPHDWRGKKF